MILFNASRAMFPIDEADLAFEAALAIEFFRHRIDVGPVELGDFRRRVASKNRHAEDARTAGDIQNPDSPTFAADFENVAERFGDGLGDRNNAENELFPNLKLMAGIHSTKRLAGFQGFFEICHAVPQGQGYVAKITHVRRTSANEKCPG